KRVQITRGALYRPCDNAEVCDLPGNGTTRPGHVDLTLCTASDAQNCTERQEHTHQEPCSPPHVCLTALVGERQERRGNVATKGRDIAAHSGSQGLVLVRPSCLAKTRLFADQSLAAILIEDAPQGYQRHLTPGLSQKVGYFYNHLILRRKRFPRKD